MPTYHFVCGGGHEEEMVCSIREYEQLGNRYCKTCRLPQARRFKPNRMNFAREGFTAEYWEHLGPDPVFVKNEAHLKQICKESGLYSRYIEDGH